MEVKAKLNNLQMSPYKVRVVANQVKDLPLPDALDMLEFSTKKAAKPLKKVLASAMANAKNNFELERDSLSIKELQVGDGRRLRRLKPRARGRGNVSQKRASNVRVVLEGGESGSEN